jgi:Alpha-L-fucosidase
MAKASQYKDVSHSALLFALLVAVLGAGMALGACGSATPGSEGTGGVKASGGSTSPGSGGASSQGGSSTSGGATSAGGAGSGGTTASAGGSASGATMIGTGGTTPATGGTVVRTGDTVAGTGGNTVPASGGVVATGGAAMGGGPATGGARTGGTTATGGVQATGGVLGTGGASVMGGATGSGGAGGSTGTCAKPMATFSDITANHTLPTWLTDTTTKFGISIHFGPYSVGAHHNEWDSRHMYCNAAIRDWYIQNFGSNGTVGYKDLIAKMTLAKFDPTVWAAAFKKSKASYVQITAQHHDRFAMWDSALTKWTIVKQAGKRDVVGELATAVRGQGLKFGVSNHILYGYSFQWCGSGADKTVDLYDKNYYDLYGDYAGWTSTSATPYASSGPPNGGCDINVGGCTSGEPNQGFMNEWLAGALEGADRQVQARSALV